MNRNFLFLVTLTAISFNVFCQMGVGTTNPDASSALEVKSTNSGILIPRLTISQRDAIVSPAEGLMVFCTNCGPKGSLSIFSDGSWQSYSICVTSPTSQGTHLVTPGQITWNWTGVPDATGYKWNTTDVYETAENMGTITSKTETGINCNTSYTRYVWVQYTCGVSEKSTLTQTISATAPLTPAEGTHVPDQTSIVWNWNAVTDAIGYKWSSINDFWTATEMGTTLTKTEAGLTSSTNYTRYVWSYNGCGYSSPVILTQSTLSACGDPLTINHDDAGGVAPVDKSVTYGTVSNIPGESGKCWITRNLGASQQATSYYDNTEASAGWYWQFNRKQGYQHDGTNRTPNTTWITSISEEINWLIENDPCRLELGTPWRIPSYTEWYNVDYYGNWTSWYGPWNSALKMHAAGSLDNIGGYLSGRGSNGFYWSSVSVSSTNGIRLLFNSSVSNTNTSDKALGFTLRCVHD